MRELPKLFNNKRECCGCGACAAICDSQAINMVEDEEGFFYPIIIESSCLRCYRCLRVCPFLSH